MAKIEYYNPNPYKVVVVSIDGSKSVINGYKRAVIEEAASIEPANSLRIIRTIPTQKTVQASKSITKKPVRGSVHRINPSKKQIVERKSIKSEAKKIQPKNINMRSRIVNKIDKSSARKANRNVNSVLRKSRRNKLGFRVASGKMASANFRTAIQEEVVGLSKNIAIGVLSYNRLQCVKRAINSIRKHTDLSQVNLFVSDESTNNDVKDYLREDAKDYVLLDNNERLGVAGNSNRLMKCMSRFKYCFLLNDDVEILSSDWLDFYVNAHKKSNMHHFCYRQPGLIGARLTDGKLENKNGLKIRKIDDRPHGAVMFYTNEIFKKVGYFDESWGEYGMEHVDWSNRVGLSGIQERGYFDVVGSNNYVKIHADKSASGKSNLRKAKTNFDKVKDDNKRIYVKHSDKIVLPSLSYVIPVRDIGRTDSIKTVVDNIRAQRFPVLDITVVEEDHSQQVKVSRLEPVNFKFLRCKRGQHFNKSKAFNFAVMNAEHNDVILHDGDILVDSWYSQEIYNLLAKHDGIHIGREVLYLTADYTNKVIANYKIDKDGECSHQVGYFEGGSLACKRTTYCNIGGFNEDFEGYGCEDCDFFHRLMQFSKSFYNERSEAFYHLHHGRVGGWQQCHTRNKELMRKFASMNKNEYIRMLQLKLRNQYPKQYDKLR